MASRIELNASPHCRGYVIRRIPQASHSPNTYAQNARTLSGGGRRRQEQSLSVSTPLASSVGVWLASGLITPPTEPCGCSQPVGYERRVIGLVLNSGFGYDVGPTDRIHTPDMP